MIKSTLVTTATITTPDLVYTSSTTGAPIGGAVTGQTNAITCIALCNIAAPNSSDETVNAVNVNIYLAKAGVGPQNSGSNCNLVVSNLTVPAGETVFFNDERIVLDSGDQIRATSSAANLLSITVSALAV